jgi:hypothetical protein
VANLSDFLRFRLAYRIFVGFFFTSLTNDDNSKVKIMPNTEKIWHDSQKLKNTNAHFINNWSTRVFEFMLNFEQVLC